MKTAARITNATQAALRRDLGYPDPPNVTPAFDVAPIRLTMEETKLILRASVSAHPIQHGLYCDNLADLGIFERVAVPEADDTARKVADCWKRARAGVAEKNVRQTHQAMHEIERLEQDRHEERPRYFYKLTDAGKQIARGITVRMHRDYRDFARRV